MPISYVIITGIAQPKPTILYMDSSGLKNIFVVDDDASIGDVLKLMLESENYHVYPFTTGKRALQYFEKEKPNLVILDYFLMGEDFLDILSRFRKAGGESLPIILMSASKEAFAAARENRIDDFIEKPFLRETMLIVVARNIN